MLGWLILYLVAINSFKASSFTITHIVSNSVLTSSMLTWVRLTFINVDFTWFSFQTRLALALIIIDWKHLNLKYCDFMKIYHLLMTHLYHNSYFPLLGMEMIYNHQCLFHKICHCTQWNICREILLLQSWRRSHYGKDSFRSHTNWTLFHNWFPAMFIYRNYINNHNIVFYLESMWTLTNIVRYLVNASPRILTWVRFTLINI